MNRRNFLLAGLASIAAALIAPFVRAEPFVILRHRDNVHEMNKAIWPVKWNMRVKEIKARPHLDGNGYVAWVEVFYEFERPNNV